MTSWSLKRVQAQARMANEQRQHSACSRVPDAGGRLLPPAAFLHLYATVAAMSSEFGPKASSP
jgi:hypothetical protein